MASAETLSFLLAVDPIGFQYGAEITYPAPEGTSNGLPLTMGVLKSTETRSMSLSLVILMVLMLLGLLPSTRLREPPLMARDLG
jgi:hypothetical protein